MLFQLTFFGNKSYNLIIYNPDYYNLYNFFLFLSTSKKKIVNSHYCILFKFIYILHFT